MENNQTLTNNQDPARRLTADVTAEMYLDVKAVQLAEKFKTTSATMNFLMRLGLTAYKQKSKIN